MARRKAKDRSKLLTHPIRTRVTQKVFQKLDDLKTNGDCQSVGEVARRILSREKITCYYKDVTFDAPMEELLRIRKEIKVIGVNINQITRSFHNDIGNKKALHTLRVGAHYKEVGKKVEELMVVLADLSKKWLQR